MKKTFITLALLTSVIIGFNSCSGCVKETTKKATEAGLSAIEGVSEAVDEHGARVAEKTTDAAGSVAEGVGKSLDRQLNEHAEKIFSVAGRTLVQGVDGFTNGFTEEVKKHYNQIPHTDNFCSGVSIDFFARSKTNPIVDAYFIISNSGKYKAKFECYDNNNKLFLTKEMDIVVNINDNSHKYYLASFALSSEEEAFFNNIKDVKITVNKL